MNIQPIIIQPTVIPSKQSKQSKALALRTLKTTTDTIIMIPKVQQLQISNSQLDNEKQVVKYVFNTTKIALNINKIYQINQVNKSDNTYQINSNTKSNTKNTKSNTNTNTNTTVENEEHDKSK